ncbi:hypothetical protein HQ585_16145 [candidate division KSB1 bacterium]|nr:hypothetical protein [candidate division KSB1 bacterium]
MLRIFIVLLINFSFPTYNLDAGWAIKGGFNTSFPNGSKGESRQGITLGMNYTRQIIEKWPLYLSCDLLYSEWGALYRDKTWPANSTENFIWVNNMYEVPTGDLLMKMIFLEIPIRAMWLYPIKKHLSLKISGGVAYSLAIMDKSKTINRDHILLNEEEKVYHQFDYLLIEDPDFRGENTGWDMVYVVGVEWERVSLEMIYIQATHSLKVLDTFQFIEEIKMSTFHLMIAVNL